MTGFNFNRASSPSGLAFARVLAGLVVLAAVAAGLVAVVASAAVAGEADLVDPVFALTEEEAAASAAGLATGSHWLALVAQASLHLSARGRLAESSKIEAVYSQAVAAGVLPAVAYRAALVAAGLLAALPADHHLAVAEAFASTVVKSAEGSVAADPVEVAACSFTLHPSFWSFYQACPQRGSYQ